jgi:hypothetical protein
VPTPPDDVLLNKGAIIERCIRRIRQEYDVCLALDDFTHIDTRFHDWVAYCAALGIAVQP